MYLHFILKFKKEVSENLILTWKSTWIELYLWLKSCQKQARKSTQILSYNYMKMNSSIEALLRQQSNIGRGGGGGASNLLRAPHFRGQSELLQQLPKVGGLGELSADSRQLVQNRTVQRDTRNQPLRATTAVPTDLNTENNIKGVTLFCLHNVEEHLLGSTSLNSYFRLYIEW